MATKNWFVSYKVPMVSGDKVHVAGPYFDYQVKDEAWDIQGYMGTTEVKTYQEDVDELVEGVLDAK